MSRRLTSIYEKEVTQFYNKSTLKKKIAEDPMFKIGKDKKGSIRVQPAITNSDRDKLVQDFLNSLTSLNLVVKQEIKPPSLYSSKFNTYKTQDQAGNEFNIVLAGGSVGNKGMTFERDIFDSLSKYFANPDEVPKPEILQILEDELDIEFTDISKTDTFNRQVKRPLTLDNNAENKGKEIADITLIDKDNNNYYISLKDVNGKTIANTGAFGMFKYQDKTIEYINKEKNNISKYLFKAAGVNIDRVINGLNEYINEIESNIQQIEIYDNTEIVDNKTLINLLKSAFDYGYIYIRKRPIGYEIKDLTTSENLTDQIGDIVKVYVKYPYFSKKSSTTKRKHISIVIHTTTNIFSFDIRNASGEFVPNQINLTTLK